MSLTEQLRTDVNTALKAGDRERAGALRMVLSELQKAAKEGGDDDVAVLRRERKRRLEAAQQFRQGGRDELADREEAEAEMIDRYLPSELDDSELRSLVSQAIAETGAQTPQDMGQVMRLVMSRAGGRVDGKRASARVREALGAG
ncbi:MAG TPA: GatB/YqeY domain-containing protein [Solirubrobacteraceae bacterium]|nr:GatB/YqeY domain-containing protein [Solirubrobacteraceae bacterium]